MPESAANSLPALLPDLQRGGTFAVKSGKIIAQPASPQRGPSGPGLIGSVDVDQLRRAKLEKRPVKGGDDRLLIPAAALMPNDLGGDRPEGAAAVAKAFTSEELKANATRNGAVLEVLLKGVRDRPASTQVGFYGPLLALRARNTVALPPQEFSAILQARIKKEQIIASEDSKQFELLRTKLEPFLSVMVPDADKRKAQGDSLVDSARALQRENVEHAVRSVVQMEDQDLSTSVLAAVGHISSELKSESDRSLAARKTQVISVASFDHTLASLPKRWESDPVGKGWGDWELALKRVAKFKDPAKREEVLTGQAVMFRQIHAPEADLDVIKAALKAAL